MSTINREAAIDTVDEYGRQLKEEKYHAGAKVTKEVIRRLTELPEADRRWIFCNEGLPEEGIEVMVLTTYPVKRVSIGRRVPKKKYWEWLDWPTDWYLRNPTSVTTICPGNEYVMAWMPLPEI